MIPETDQKLGYDPAQRVDTGITNRGGSYGDKRLVKFIARRIKQDEEKG
jgi:hypothetical protein